MFASTRTSTRRPRGAHVTARHATLLAGALCSLVAWLIAGGDGLAGGVTATVLVVAFFWTGMVPLFVAQRGQSGVAAGLGILLLTYMLRLALVLLALRTAQRLEIVDVRWLGVTIIACGLTYTAVHVALSVRRDRPRSEDLGPDVRTDGTTP